MTPYKWRKQRHECLAHNSAGMLMLMRTDDDDLLFEQKGGEDVDEREGRRNELAEHCNVFVVLRARMVTECRSRCNENVGGRWTR